MISNLKSLPKGVQIDLLILSRLNLSYNYLRNYRYFGYFEYLIVEKIY